MRFNELELRLKRAGIVGAIVLIPVPAITSFMPPLGAVAGGRVAVGAPEDDTANLEEDAAYVFGFPGGVLQPEIRVEHPAGTVLADGAANVGFGGTLLGSSASRMFTIGNLGSAELSGIVVTVEGAQSGDFVFGSRAVVAQAAASLEG